MQSGLRVPDGKDSTGSGIGYNNRSLLPLQEMAKERLRTLFPLQPCPADESSKEDCQASRESGQSRRHRGVPKGRSTWHTAGAKSNAEAPAIGLSRVSRGEGRKLLRAVRF